MKYICRRYYKGRRACSKGIIVDAVSEDVAIETMRKYWDNTEDRISVKEIREDNIRRQDTLEYYLEQRK